MSQNTSIIVSMDDAERAAKAMSASGFFADARQASQAIVKILAGQELGFGPFASMTGVSIIQGKPVLGANLLAAAVKRTGKYNYRVLEMTDQACELAFYEGGLLVGQSRFTMDDARKAGVADKPTWKQYPRNMLFARALSNGQRWYAPDIFNGATVYTPEELGATVDGETGEIIDAQAVEPEPQPEPAQAPAEPSAALDLETAMAVTGQDGKPYGDCTSDELSNKSIGILAGIKKNNLTPEKREALQYKLDAIKVILAARAEAE